MSPTAESAPAIAGIMPGLEGWTPVIEGLSLVRWERATDNGEVIRIHPTDDGIGFSVWSDLRKRSLTDLGESGYLSPLKAIDMANAVAEFYGGWA